MPQNPIHKARTRAEILGHAARLFRLRGYEGTNIDDVMLAAGLTRGAFYAHFKSKEDLFFEIVSGGLSLLTRLRSSAEPETVLNAYLDKAGLAATVQSCNLAALPGDVARAPLSVRLAYANVLQATIAELARRKSSKLDSGATVAAILAIGAVTLARASGDARLSDWLLRCADRAVRPLLRLRASPVRPRSRSRRTSAVVRPYKLRSRR